MTKDEGRTNTVNALELPSPAAGDSSSAAGPNSEPPKGHPTPDTEYPNRWYHELLRILIKATARLAFAIVGRMRVEGAENVPRKGGVILAPNHVSAADWPAVGTACPRSLRWMAKSELFQTPIVGPFCRLHGSFAVHRGTADRAALRLAEEVVRAGHALVIFPEGAVSETATLQPLKHGLAMVALRAQVPVVPTAVIGTERLLPYGKNIPRFVRKPVRVRFGKPISFADLWEPTAENRVPPRAAIEAATAQLERAIRAELDRG